MMSWEDILKRWRPKPPASIEEGGTAPNAPTWDEIMVTIQNEKHYRFLEEVRRLMEGKYDN
tara:strand:+ start:398 stop:580 length:183 start_codon:yes stop_codon:yes gene_type:complete